MCCFIRRLDWQPIPSPSLERLVGLKVSVVNKVLPQAVSPVAMLLDPALSSSHNLLSPPPLGSRCHGWCAGLLLHVDRHSSTVSVFLLNFYCKPLPSYLFGMCFFLFC